MDLNEARQNVQSLEILGVGHDLFGGGFKKTGRAYKKLCPFHKERHASFYIYPHTQTYICYGCGQQGKILGLVEGVFRGERMEMLMYLESQGGNLDRDEILLERLIQEEFDSN